jgi:hypothetical protein
MVLRGSVRTAARRGMRIERGSHVPSKEEMF